MNDRSSVSIRISRIPLLLIFATQWSCPSLGQNQYGDKQVATFDRRDDFSPQPQQASTSRNITISRKDNFTGSSITVTLIPQYEDSVFLGFADNYARETEVSPAFARSLLAMGRPTAFNGKTIVYEKTAEYRQVHDDRVGDYLLCQYRVYDFSKMTQQDGVDKKYDSKDLELQVIDIHYPYTSVWKELKQGNHEAEMFSYIKQRDLSAYRNMIDDQNFLRASIIRGMGEGVSISHSSGKYHLWPGAPASFGDDYDSAGLVLKDGCYYLFCEKLNYRIVFLSSTNAERQFTSGQVESLSATPLEVVKMKFPKLSYYVIASLAVASIVIIIMLYNTLKGRKTSVRPSNL